MKNIKNPYSYNLNDFQELLINEQGEIIGGFEVTTDLQSGQTVKFPNFETLTITKELRVFVVKEVKKTGLTVQEKINLINNLHNKVVYDECDGDTCLQVLATIDDETKAVLRQLGKTNDWIERYKIEFNDGSEVIDLTQIGFDFANWWDPMDGFCLEEKER